jgi:hypothetical protein
MSNKQRAYLGGQAMQSEKKAARHIDISLRVKQIAARCIPQCQVYVATYTAGSAGQIYQHLEEKSGEEFWSIKAWTPPPRRRLKDPDVIVTLQNQVQFIVEVKWGAVRGSDDTDLVLADDEWRKMRDLLTGVNLCRVSGPAAVDHRRYRSQEFTEQRDFHINSNTKLVLVTDLVQTKQCLPGQYAEALNAWKNATSNMLIADIHTQVDGVLSLAGVFEA